MMGGMCSKVAKHPFLDTNVHFACSALMILQNFGLWLYFFEGVGGKRDDDAFFWVSQASHEHVVLYQWNRPNEDNIKPH